MATVSNLKGGCKRVIWNDREGDRRGMRVGKMSKRHARVIANHVQEIVNAQISGGAIEQKTVKWLAENASAKLLKKMVAHKLIDDLNITLEELRVNYLKTRARGVSEATLVRYGQSFKKLISFFGEDVKIRSITEEMAGEFVDWLTEEEGLSDSTTCKHCQRAHQFWNFAIKERYLLTNVFESFDRSSKANPLRMHYVSRDTIEAVVEVLPDLEWKAFISVCRDSGFRSYSEALLLRWEYFDWEANRISVPSPKTVSQGKPFREVPIFKGMKPALLRLRAKSSSETGYLFPNLMASRKSLWKKFRGYVIKAGFQPWPRLFHNLRASCETDAVEEYPFEICVKWFGHSKAMARKHYLMTQQKWFDKAAGVARDAA